MIDVDRPGTREESMPMRRNHAHRRVRVITGRNGESYLKFVAGLSSRFRLMSSWGFFGAEMAILSNQLKKNVLLWEGFFRLETRDDRIKQLYSRYQFSIRQQKLISIEEVPNIDTTLRFVATAQVELS
ncbi:hypothetical protein TNCV_77881 [Trichonephila clavipes]|nr:hypothetical protein TNCV_77881 [Trichonephila clavipes]